LGALIAGDTVAAGGGGGGGEDVCGFGGVEPLCGGEVCIFGGEGGVRGT